jgi:ribose transport system permease protein
MATATVESASPRGQLVVGRLLSSYGVYLLAAIVFVVTCIAIPGFLSAPSIRALLVLSSILGVASIGQTLVVIVGGLDLSIAAVIGLSSVMLAVLTGKGWSFWLTALVIAATVVVVGVVNALVSYFLRTPSLVVTLAVASVLVGITMGLNTGSAGGTIPGWITNSVSTNQDTGGLPVPPIVVFWAVATVVVVVLQRRSPTFRRLYAAGTNRDAARLALVRVPVMWVVAFVISAAGAALAGLFLGGFSGGANIDVGQPYLFLTIAAVVVGGTSLLGGRGGAGRTMAGSFLICNLTTLLIGVGIDTNIQQVLLGVLIVLLVFIYGREAHVRGRI